MLKRVALAGKPLAGKSTLARMLVDKYGYRRASMSSILVDELVSQLNSQTADGIYQNKEFWRGSLQRIGDDLGFQDQNRIIGIMQRVLKLSGAWDHPDEPVVLEAIRGEMQASAARALGFVVVNLWVDEETQRRRAGSTEDYAHLRESLSTRPDIETDVKSATVYVTPALDLENVATLIAISDEEGLSHGPADQPFTPGSFADWSSRW